MFDLKYQWFNMVWVTYLPIKTLISFHIGRHKSTAIVWASNTKVKPPISANPQRSEPSNHKNCHFSLLHLGTFIQPKRRCCLIALLLFNSCLTLDNMCHLQQRFFKNIWNGRTHFYYKHFKWVYHDHLISVNQLALPICTRPSWR